MVGQQVSMQEMQLLQEFHSRRGAKLESSITDVAVRAAGLFVFLLISACAPSPDGQRLNSRTLSQATAILDDVAKTELTLSPETASRLGLDELGGANTTSRLDDHSQAGFERRRLITIDLLSQIQSQPHLPEDHPLARDLLVTQDALSRLVKVQSIGHGQFNLSRATPYAVQPYSGIWIEGPDLLANEHRIENIADAATYLHRLRALPDAIDDTRRRLLADAEAGLVPPVALLAETRKSIISFVDLETGDLQILDQTFASLLQSLPDLGEAEIAELTATSQLISERDLRPAYGRLLNTVDELISKAPIQSGIWVQPNGHIAYEKLLKWYIDEEQLVDDVHKANMADVARRDAALHQVLDLAELEPGPLADRLAALTVELAEEAVAAERALGQPSVSPEVPDQTAPFTSSTLIKRPLAPGSLTGYTYMAPRLDGQRPGLVNHDELTSALWPGYMIPALQLQEDIVLRQPFTEMKLQRRSNIRALITYPGFQQAWQMYAAEAYRDEHLSSAADQIGQRQLLLMAAALAAADTGLHHKRWSLDQTSEYLVETTGLPETLMREAVLRIVANPGRAAARLIGYRRLTALRTRAEAVLGKRFDETDFQRVLLIDGPRPFWMIERDVERWYEGQLAPSD